MTRKPKLNNDIMVGSQGAENLGLKEPYPASPGRPGKYCLYITRDHRFITFICCTEYAAKKFLEILLKNETAGKTKGLLGEDDTIACQSGLIIRSPNLYRLWEYELSTNEELWELDEYWVKQAMRMKVEGTPIKETEKIERPKNEKIFSAKPKVSKDGLITIGQIAEELKMEPREARGILRDKKIKKPEHGWAWSKNEVDEIKKILQNNN